MSAGLGRRNSLHDTESLYAANRSLIVRLLCDSRLADDALYRQNGEILNGELAFVLLPGMETLQLEPTTLPPSPRAVQLSRGLTSFYRVVTSLARARVAAETVNWSYAKLTHFLHPALEAGSHTLAMVSVAGLRGSEVGDGVGCNARR